MTQEELETAILKLEKLIDGFPGDEGVFQDWFESNPCIWEILRFKTVIPHPEIQDHRGERFIPDFMARRVEGDWEIVELKTPDTDVLMDLERRSKFYASMESYISQCRDYARLFQDPLVKARFRRAYGSEVRSRPDSLLIAGRSSGLDRNKVDDILGDRVPRITHQTFDDILDALEFHRSRNFSHFEGLRGVTLNSTVIFDRPSEPVPIHFCDIGVELHRNRVAILLDEKGSLNIKIWDDIKNLRVYVVPQGASFVWGELLRITMSIGCGSPNSVIVVEIEGIIDCVGRVISETRLTNFTINLPTEVPIVIGSDFGGHAESSMCVGKYDLILRTLTFRERIAMRMELKKYAEAGIANGIWVPYTKFRGHQFLHTPKHPI